MEALKELHQFLDVTARLDLKAVSITHILELTGTADGRFLIVKCPNILKSIHALTMDPAETVAKDALRVIVNLSADPTGPAALIAEIPNLISRMFVNILNERSPLADGWAMVMSNVSRVHKHIEAVVDELDITDNLLDQLVSAFTKLDYNQAKCNLNYLASIFSNISQSPRGRAMFCSADTDRLQRLLSFVNYDNAIRRGGIIGLLKNVCFDATRHEWLLHNVNVLPYILLPLAGAEEFSDEDNDKFPVELQYLDETKRREPDPDMRKMLLESLAQLCSTRKEREFLRDQGTYELLRELHKFELSDAGDRFALLACENVVDVLIRTEEEIGEDNLKDLDIPNDLVEKFEKEL